MNARVPQDVDLEERLVYGLTPIRLCCLLAFWLPALAAWKAGLPPAARTAVAMVLLAVGAAVAWGRWRSRPLDRWALDAGLFALRRLRSGPRAEWVPRPVDLDQINLLALAEPPDPGWDEEVQEDG
jgi:hypothetical protein